MSFDATPVIYGLFRLHLLFFSDKMSRSFQNSLLDGPRESHYLNSSEPGTGMTKGPGISIFSRRDSLWLKTKMPSHSTLWCVRSSSIASIDCLYWASNSYEETYRGILSILSDSDSIYWSPDLLQESRALFHWFLFCFYNSFHFNHSLFFSSFTSFEHNEYGPERSLVRYVCYLEDTNRPPASLVIRTISTFQ